MTFYLKGLEYDPNREICLTFWQCSNCGKGACGESPWHAIEGRFDFEKFTDFYPRFEPVEAPKGTPEDVANAFMTAKKNLKSGQHGDYEAACIMARRSVELAVKGAGGEGHSLKAKIDDLEARRIISPALREWAHEVRDIGNDGAHEAAVTQQDAEQAVYFAEMLFTYLYTLPEMIEERRKKS